MKQCNDSKQFDEKPTVFFILHSGAPMLMVLLHCPPAPMLGSFEVWRRFSKYARMLTKKDAD